MQPVTHIKEHSEAEHVTQPCEQFVRLHPDKQLDTHPSLHPEIHPNTKHFMQ